MHGLHLGQAPLGLGRRSHLNSTTVLKDVGGLCCALYAIITCKPFVAAAVKAGLLVAQCISTVCAVKACIAGDASPSD